MEDVSDNGKVANGSILLRISKEPEERLPQMNGLSQFERSRIDVTWNRTQPAV